MAERTVKVPGISCGHCVNTIEREVAELEGVRTVKADAATREVTVAWDEGATGWEAVDALLREINYPPAT
ncbi:MAG: cation transporter [Longimicrobiales bacterium]|nr:cation transporter [Longimicrobiales bacterium]